MMYKKMISILAMSFLSVNAYAVNDTGWGKILTTQGHSSPNCRIVRHQETATEIIRNFRILDVATDDDVSAVVLSALISNRDVNISYEPLSTTGCGTEPKLGYITIR